jgi:hypothetical protein
VPGAYAGGMILPPALLHHTGNGMALFTGLPQQDTLLHVITHLALHGPVRVVIGGNRFRAPALSRLIRRRTVQLDAVLQRIQIARPFTCYQTVALCAQLTTTSQPLVVLDLLATFMDENISASESERLLRQVVDHLQALCRQAPVIVSITPPSLPDRAGLETIVEETADYLFHHQAPDQPTSMPLF